MSYQAEVKEKVIEGGKLRVTLQYSDGVKSHTETMETKCAQRDDWILEEAKRRCAELDALAAFAGNIKVGLVDTSLAETKKPVVDEARALYESQLRKFGAAQQAMRMGILAETHEAFTSLKTWLINNFKAEYLDLFIE